MKAITATLALLSLAVAASADCTVSGYMGQNPPPCYLDSVNNPILPEYVPLAYKDVTPQKCAQACYDKSANNKYFGIEGGQFPTCTCGSTASVPSSTSTGCDIPCPGDGSAKCGGQGFHMLLFESNCDGSSPPPVPVSPGGSPVPYGTPQKATKGGSGGSAFGFCDVLGLVLLVAIVVAALSYGIAIVVFKFALKKEGTDIFPAFEQIKQGPTLVKDGAMFTFETARGLTTRRGGYDAK